MSGRVLEATDKAGFECHRNGKRLFECLDEGRVIAVKTGEICDFFRLRGLGPVGLETVGGDSGCHELVFESRGN